MTLDERNEKVVGYFRNNFNCAQSVFSVYAPDFGTGEAEARRIACGFGGGMGALQKTCGAITGGIMALGAGYFDERDVPGTKTLVYKKVRGLIGRFESKNGSVECFPLLGVDITTEEGLKNARERMLFHHKCERYVLDVCEILDELFAEKR
jgi:C_GCAxxG_C_C family probable redox protein